MARKSRKLTQLTTDLATDSSPSELISVAPLNKTAIYARLSIYDIYRPDPDSMEYQVLFLNQYIKDHPDLNLVDTYIDNGFSGTHFSRPNFKRLLDDIYAGKINCVVVKDLSRFGRNYLETGMYLQDVFPKYGVRFIAINDEYDSKANDVDDLAVILKNILNDFYSREISMKTARTYDILLEQGNLIPSNAPFGYKKDPKNPSRYIKDSEVSVYVPLIFEWYLSGISMIKIASHLNEMNVVTTSRRKHELSKNKANHRQKGSDVWTYSAVRGILENPVYAGDRVYKKTMSRKYLSSKVIQVPRDQWVCIPDSHEPYISHETHDQILAKLDHNTKNHKNWKANVKQNPVHENFYREILRCGTCGYRMIFSSEANRTRNSAAFVYQCNSLHYKYKLRGHTFSIAKNKIDIFIQCHLIQEFESGHFLYDWLTNPNTSVKILDYNKKLHEQYQDTFHNIQENKKQKLHQIELYHEKIISKTELTTEMESLNHQQISLQKLLESLKLQQETAQKALSVSNPWIQLFGQNECPYSLNTEIVQKYIYEILAYPNHELSCEFQEAFWKEALYIIYQQIEEDLPCPTS